MLYCLCLLEREWPLTKPDLPIIGNCTQQSFLFANPKTTLFKKFYTNTKRTNSICIQIQKRQKHTDEGSYSVYQNLVDSVWSPSGKGGLKLPLTKKIRKASWVDFFGNRECENSHWLSSLHRIKASTVWMHDSFQTGLLLYPQSEGFSLFIGWNISWFFSDLPVVWHFGFPHQKRLQDKHSFGLFVQRQVFLVFVREMRGYSLPQDNTVKGTFRFRDIFLYHLRYHNPPFYMQNYLTRNRMERCVSGVEVTEERIYMKPNSFQEESDIQKRCSREEYSRVEWFLQARSALHNYLHQDKQ